MRAFHYWAMSCLLLSGCYLFHRAPSGDTSAASDVADAAVPDAGELSSCTIRTFKKGEMFLPLDMVWVVDSSRSMADERERIQMIMNQFVADAEARNYDVRLTMVTSDNIVPPPLGTDAQRYRFVERDVDSHEPLDALISEFPRYRDFLRPNAALHFVIVTDDDSDITADAFERLMNRLVGRPFTVHAVASPDVDGQPCRTEGAGDFCATAGRRAAAFCGASAVGSQYIALAQATNGELISVCTQDWSQVFGPLLEAVTPTEIPCMIELDADAPLDATQVVIRTGDSPKHLSLVAGPMSCASHDQGFYYADGIGAPQLMLCPQTCDAAHSADVELDVGTNCH